MRDIIESVADIANRLYSCQDGEYIELNINIEKLKNYIKTELETEDLKYLIELMKKEIENNEHRLHMNANFLEVETPELHIINLQDRILTMLELKLELIEKLDYFSKDCGLSKIMPIVKED